MFEINKLYQGDCLDIMPMIDDKSIDMVLTSPPYDNLRTYNNNLEWGEHVWKPVIRELFRIVKDGGVVVWIVGDATINGSETGTSFKQALYFKEIGFNLLDTMIYHKLNYAPAYPSLKRYAGTFEYMFVFSKGKPVTFNPVQKSKATNGTLQRLGKYRKADGTFTEKNKIVDTGRITKDAENVWEYPTSKDKYAGNHPAVFPLILAIDHIISWSNEGDAILDPFAGSGMTAIACLNTKRNYILIEKEEKYCKIIEKRIKEHPPTLF